MTEYLIFEVEEEGGKELNTNIVLEARDVKHLLVQMNPTKRVGPWMQLPALQYVVYTRRMKRVAVLKRVNQCSALERLR